MARTGRPPSGRYDIPDMVAKIEEYTKRKIDEGGLPPILKEVCYLNNWDYDYVMKLQRENGELRQSIKGLLSVKEISLEKGALLGDYDRSMAIFSLKQLGWSDTLKMDVTTATSERAAAIAKYLAGEDDDGN